jgi:hypothetical protein
MKQVHDRRRWTADQHRRMAEAGLLDEDDRIELTDREIVHMAPIDSVRASTVRASTRLLYATVPPDRAVIAVQDPLSLDARNEPQPDVMLLRPRADGYRAAHPGPADVLLIEVAGRSVAKDRGDKIQRCAAALVPEVWLVGLPAQRIEVHRRPAPGG